jgi:hypothetical protein
MRSTGEIITNSITFTAAGATTNIFQVAGAVQVVRLCGVFTDVTDVADIDAMSLDFHDGGAGVQITLAAGTTCDGVADNSLLLKTGDNTVAIALLDSANAVINDTLGPGIAWPFTLNAKDGASNYIRFTYTSAGGCNATILWSVEWRHLVQVGVGMVTAV